jgi:cold shock protein
MPPDGTRHRLISSLASTNGTAFSADGGTHSARGAAASGGGTRMNTGTVKWFDEIKGYGFIQPDTGGKDVFVHISAVQQAGLRGLVEGQKVTFDVENDRRSGKPAAVNLQAG